MTESSPVVLLTAVLVLVLLTPACAVFFGGIPDLRSAVMLAATAGSTVAIVALVWAILGSALPIALFQGSVASVCVTCLLAVGLRTAAARALLPFLAPWCLLVLVPVGFAAFDVRSGYLVTTLGTLDFGGAAVLGVCTGVAGSVIALLSGREATPSVPVRTSVPLVIAGCIAVLGFVALGVGAELVIDDSTAVIARNVALAAVAGGAGWAVAQLVNVRRATPAGIAAGLIAGPVSALAGLPWLDPVAIAVLALGAAILGHVVAVAARAGGAGGWATLVGVLLVPGALGLLATGILARDIGLLYSGHVELTAGQVSGLLAVLAYAIVVSVLIAIIARRFTSFAGGRARRRSPSPISAELQ